MARVKTAPRCAVRVDPAIWVDTDFVELSIAARCLWFDSMFYLAAVGDPQDYFPHVELVAMAGRQSESIVHELTGSGLWTLCALGYYVHSHNGCGVHPEQRAQIPDSVRHRVYARDDYRCVTCGSPTFLTLDHIHPWSLGGSDDEANLQTMCRSCNSRKGARV